jgi:hypothetical protein
VHVLDDQPDRAHLQHGGHEQQYPGPATDRVLTEQHRFDHDARRRPAATPTPTTL